jgi:hypothetical protein
MQICPSLYVKQYIQIFVFSIVGIYMKGEVFPFVFGDIGLLFYTIFNNL